MRVSLHPERGIAVVSLWSGATCRATFQLPLNDATRLADLLDPPDPATPDAGHQYPGLADDHADGPDAIYGTAEVVLPHLPRAS